MSGIMTSRRADGNSFRGHEKSRGAGRGFPIVRKNDCLAPRIASFAAFATRNFTTFLALIWIVSPVAGLRPMRALRFTRTSLPKPGTVKPFFAFLYANAERASSAAAACFLLMTAFSATAATI